MPDPEDNQTTEQAFDSPADEIASLLVNDKDETTAEDNNDEETLSEESTEEQEDNESSDDSSEESGELDSNDESEVTWGKALGVNEDSLAFDEEGNISGVNVKVNGKLSTVEMSDLIKDYQGNKAYTEKSQGLANERRQFEDAKIAFERDANTKVEEATALADYLGKKLVGEFDGINWDQLRVENPAEYAAARQDYASRAQELQQITASLTDKKNQSQAINQQAFQQQSQARLKAQFETMVDNNPTWSDDAALKKDMSGLRNFASNQYGFTDNDFASVQDARIIELIKDAKAYREGVKVATAKRKAPVPKFQKSTGKTRKRTSKLDQLTKTAKAAKGSNKRRAQTDAVAELLLGG